MTTQPTQTIQESSADAKCIEQLEAQVASLEAEAQAELDARIEKQGVTVNTGK